MSKFLQWLDEMVAYIRVLLIDLDNIRSKLSSYYSLNVGFSPHFLHTDGQLFSHHKPLQNVHFRKVDNFQVFFRIVHIYW